MKLKNVKCPICSKVALHAFPAVYKNDMIAGISVSNQIENNATIFFCSSCDFKFTYPTLNAEDLEEIYKLSSSEIWESNSNICERRDYISRINRIDNYLSCGKVLDVGCYTGGFLGCLNDKWEKYGIEPSISAARIARDKSIKIISDKLPVDSIYNDSFNLITSLNVIEHVPNPRDFLIKIRALLTEDGVLFLETGNFDSRFSRLLSENWSYYHIPEHVSFFSANGLKNLLEDLNFEILEIADSVWHRKPNSIKQRVKHYIKFIKVILFSLYRGAFKLIGSDPLIKEIPWLTHKDHMYIIARKVS